MKAVLVHNYLRSSGPSGENLAYEQERDLLRRYGHEIVEFTINNDELADKGWTGNLRAATTAPWSFSALSRLKRALRAGQPDVVHVHNTFPLLSPSVFRAARGLPCATVVTLHNYRIFCAAGVPLRNGRPCIECLDKRSSLPGLRYGCYRGSRLATVPPALSVSLHRLLGTWRNEVDAFVCLTDFQRELMLKSGLTDERLFVKPHCYLDPPTPLPWAEREKKVVFLGRLGPEKGIPIVLEAWRLWGASSPLLEIIGDGSEEERARSFAEQAGNVGRVEFKGRLPFREGQRLLGRARAAVLPSISYEGFPMVIREAFALGVPVVASRIGSIQTLISEGQNGALFETGNPADLLRVMQRLWSDDDGLRSLSSGARKTFDERYTAELNHEILMKIYEAAIRRRQAKLKRSRRVS